MPDRAPSLVRCCCLAALVIFAATAFADTCPGGGCLFVLVGTAPGEPNIAVSVELNPQPLPPRVFPPTTLDLSNAMNPRLVNPGTESGWVMGIGITERGIGQEILVNFLEGDPDKPIVVGSTWNAVDGAGKLFQVLWTDFPNVAPGTWVGVNPQPLPPGSVGAAFQVCPACDPIMGFEVMVLDPAGASTMYTFQQVPEPGTLSLLASGFLVLAGWRRRG